MCVQKKAFHKKQEAEVVALTLPQAFLRSVSHIQVYKHKNNKNNGPTEFTAVSPVHLCKT